VSGKGRAPFVSSGPLFPSAIARPGVREEAAFGIRRAVRAVATFVGLFLQARETRAPGKARHRRWMTRRRPPAAAVCPRNPLGLTELNRTWPPTME
jgi:hypothetical protein